MPLFTQVPQPWLLGEGDPMVSQAALTAQRAYFIGIWVPVPVTLTSLRVSFGTAGNGNYDVGIYDSGGTALYRQGSTTTTGLGASTVTVTLGTALALSAGRYYVAFWLDNATDTVAVRGGQTSMDVLKNVNSQASGLPSTMSGAASGTGNRPIVLGLISGGYS